LIPDLNFFESVIVVIQEGLIFSLITLLMLKGKEIQVLHHALKQDLEKLRETGGNNGKVHIKQEKDDQS
jgi:hypothetical protein